MNKIATSPKIRSSDHRQITATVNTAQINVFSSSQIYIDGINMHVGRNLQESVSLSLESTPPSAVTVTVTSNGPSIVAVSADGTVAGGSSVSFPGVTTTTVGEGIGDVAIVFIIR